MKYTVESGIDLPRHREFDSDVYPFGKMNVNDSFAIETDRPVRQAISAWHKRRDERFTCRKVPEGGFRVWRIK